MSLLLRHHKQEKCDICDTIYNDYCWFLYFTKYNKLICETCYKLIQNLIE